MTLGWAGKSVFIGFIGAMSCSVSFGQPKSSSLYVNDQVAVEAERREAEAAGVDLATGTSVSGAIQSSSLIAVKPVPVRKFRKHDFIKIIVSERKQYSSEGEGEQRKRWDIDAKLSEWFRFYPRQRLGSDRLPNGQPGADFSFNNRYKTEGEAERTDDLAMRIEAKVIDVKPNGTLVLEAKKSIQVDEEVQTMTLTGMCRGEDVTADNSVLSSNVAEMEIHIKHTGTVRDGTRRGWIPRALDWLRPF
jgi:flagellar L-ring protein precursor FlgH